jgi:virginiamycin B lyase
MYRFRNLIVLSLAASAVLWMSLPLLRSAALPSTGLAGAVKSSDGKPLEGVAISARGEDANFSVSVFTNHAGEYYFPSLTDGRYRVWAQAVGYETARGEQAIVSGKRVQQNFSMKPMADFHRQLSATEWADSLPEETPQDRRAKELLHYNCSSCHITGFVLAKRFDAQGWGTIINYMIEKETSADGANRKLIQSYKEDLVSYLTKVRGPNDYPWKWKPLPRATGEATQIVVTEYDLPRGDDPQHIAHDGSDWSEGIPSKYLGDALHDSALDKQGYVYFTDNTSPGRTIGKLDPRTGKVTNYKLDDANGFAVRTHGAAADAQGNIWLTNGTEGTILKFDPKTEQFQRFPKPASMTKGIGPTITVDSKGNAWATENNGVFRLNPQNGEYTELKSKTKGGNPYGLAVDSEDNCWFAQITGDRVGFVNAKTGEVGEVVLPQALDAVAQKDRDIGEKTGAITNAAPLYQLGPRRMGADRHGDGVWVAEYWTGKLAKIDIHSHKVTEYPVLSMYSHPYAVIVDKNHMVWVSLMNSDRVAKFDPNTQKFTEYPLATLGTEARYIDVDDSTEAPTLWLPYSRVNKLGRVEFRSGQSIASAGN